MRPFIVTMRGNLRKSMLCHTKVHFLREIAISLSSQEYNTVREQSARAGTWLVGTIHVTARGMLAEDTEPGHLDG